MYSKAKDGAGAMGCATFVWTADGTITRAPFGPVIAKGIVGARLRLAPVVTPLLQTTAEG